MNKLIKFEMRKIFGSKSFVGCLPVLLIFFIILFYIVLRIIGVNTGNILLGTASQALDDHEYNGKYAVISSLCGQVPLFLSVFVPLFISSDFSQGILPVLIAKGYSKRSILGAKCISVVIISTIFSIACLLAAGITGTRIGGWGGNIDARFIVTIISQLLVIYAYASFYLLLSVIIRKAIISTVVSVMSMFLLNMIVTGFSNIFDKLSIDKYHIPDMLLNISNNNVSWNMIQQVIITSLIYIAVLNMISFIDFTRKDVK